MKLVNLSFLFLMDGQIKSRMKANKNLKIIETLFEMFWADLCVVEGKIQLIVGGRVYQFHKFEISHEISMCG